MKHKRELRNSQAEAAIEPLFEALIKADDERFEEITGSVNRKALLTTLVKRLRSQYVRGDFLVLSMAFARLGIRPVANELVDLALDGEAPLEARLTAYDALAANDPSRAAALDRALDSGVRTAMADARVRELIDLTVESIEQSVAIRVLLESAPTQEVREATLQRIEAFRAEAEAPAFIVYDAAMRSAALANIHGPMLDAIVGDNSVAAQVLLEEIAQFQERPSAALVDAARQRIAAALDETRDAREGRAQLTVGDVTGFDMHIERRHQNGSLRSVVLSVRNPALVQDGNDLVPLVVPRRPESAPIFSEDTLLAEIPLEEAAWLTRSLVSRRDLSKEPMLRTAAALAMDVPRLQAPPQISPAAKADAEDIDELLQHDAYDTWVFVPFELSSAGVNRPPLAERDWESWIRNAAHTLAGGRVQYELVRRCHYMARWHLARGEAREAALQTRIAQDLQADFEKSPLVRRLLLRVCVACADDGAVAGERDGFSGAEGAAPSPERTA